MSSVNLRRQKRFDQFGLTFLCRNTKHLIWKFEEARLLAFMPFGCHYYRMSKMNFFPGRIFMAAIYEMHENKIIQSGEFDILLKTTVFSLEVTHITETTTIFPIF